MLAVLVSIGVAVCSRHVAEPPPSIKGDFHPPIADERIAPETFTAPPVQLAIEPTWLFPIPTPALASAPVADVAVVAAAVEEPVRPLLVTLTREQVEEVFVTAGWPPALIPQAIAVARCESQWRPTNTGDGGNSVGLMMIGRSRPGWQGWFLYFGEDESRWGEAVFNARVALRVYYYDIDRGQEPWTQWTCKP